MYLQALLSHKNPLTELRRASSVVPWIVLLGKVLGKFSLYLPLLVSLIQGAGVEGEEGVGMEVGEVEGVRGEVKG